MQAAEIEAERANQARIQQEDESKRVEQAKAAAE